MSVAHTRSQSQEENDIYVAIPPPLISPLTLQTQGSNLAQPFPTPGSSTNSCTGPVWSTQESEHTRLESSHGTTTVHGHHSTSLVQRPDLPVSPIGVSLPAQLLNRLYPLSIAATPSTDVSCASTSSQGSFRSNTNVLSLYVEAGSNSNGLATRQANVQYPRLERSMDIVYSSGISSEQTRTAAATAIANTLQQRDGGRPPRGESPYIPSSLSMLFSDPEVMQAQEDIGNPEQSHDHGKLPRRFGGRFFQNTVDETDGNSDSSDTTEGSNSDNDASEDEGRLDDLSRKLKRRLSKETRHGYEVVQDDSVFSNAALLREEYIAPHEPSSSSPLFPSPLTTLGRFAPGAILANSSGGYITGRVWQDYGTMDNSRPNVGQHATPATPMHQSHAAYYHAVSNYMYATEDENSLGNADVTGNSGSRSGAYVNRCVPSGHYAVPDDRWRRQHERDESRGSRTSSSGDRRGHERRSDDDHWLWGIVLSTSACWLCCESPVACCTSACCL